MGHAPLWVTLGGTIYAFMGAGHAILTLLDVWRPRAFTPVDDRVRTAMQSTGVRFSRGRAGMWDAWLGFNISHGLGVLLFGLFAVFAAQHDSGSILEYPAAFPALLLISTSYMALAARFWFWLPLVGTMANTACFAVAWLV